jgi:hypothetical protein
MDDLTHHHLTLYAGDWERLKEIYGNNPRLPPTKVYENSSEHTCAGSPTE